MIKSTRNQLANITNPYQTKAKRVLCVCSAGLLRSPTMANTLHKEYGYNTRACGSCVEFALIPISEALVYWADEIVFVNKDNILDLPDQFCWNEGQLVEIIKEQYRSNTGE